MNKVLRERIKKYLKGLGYALVSESFYNNVDRWRRWYEGYLHDFHDYTIYNGSNQISCHRARLNMGKRGPETWADLIWNDECAISVEGEANETALAQVLADNDFNHQTSQLIEKAFALGTGAFVVYPESYPTGKPIIDYIDADAIFPLDWYNDECKSCAFAKYSANADGTGTLQIMMHMQQPDGTYNIRNDVFKVNKTASSMIKVKEGEGGVEPEYTSRTKRFAFVKPAIVNNFEPVPMGISVYANAIDVLKAVDLAFDGFVISLALGRPRVGVSMEALKMDNSTGDMVPTFDPNDAAFYILSFPDTKDKKPMIEDLTTQYRARDFEGSIQTALKIYGDKIGLGDKAFRWDQGSVATATQVIAENSGMLRTMGKHQLGIEKAITTVVTAIYDILQKGDPGKITVEFDDSSVRDKDAERARAFSWVAAGKFPFRRYLIEYEQYSEADADAIVAEAAKESASMGFFPAAE